MFVGVCGAVDGFDLFVVAFYGLRYITCTTVADFDTVSVEDFSSGAMIGKCLHNRFKKSLPMFDVTHFVVF